MTTTTTTTTRRTEEVLVLYGSQTGNSEQAAIELCEQAAVKLSPEAVRKLTGRNDVVAVRCRHMQLDDFLELERAAWTRLLVIVVSSYGVGAAPLGAYRFRELCDAWTEQQEDGMLQQSLEGVSYAMCGLGDSKYTTFFQNPTAIDRGLTLVGAKRVGPLGKADASGTGEAAQGKVVDEWRDGIWKHLAAVLVEEPVSNEKLKEMQSQTVDLCRKINPDFLPEKQSLSPLLVRSILIAVLAVAVYYFLQVGLPGK
jgi:sulfite reductase alpha subunit-like flavoprotein